MPNSFTGINPNWGLKWRRSIFLEGLIDKLPLYFSDPEKIKQIIHFVVKYFHESLTSKHVIKIIKSLHNDSVSYIVANFIHFDLFRKIETDCFLAFLKEKQLEGVPSNYLRDLINGYMERKPALDYCSGLQPIQKFIKTYNRENPKSPIEASKSLINYHFWHQSV